jgi:RNA-directed DNA polymerase
MVQSWVSLKETPEKGTYFYESNSCELQGHLNYYAVSGNHPSPWWFCNQVRWLWLKSLRRRSQKARLSWERFIRIVDRFFPAIKVLHPLPLHRFDAKTRGRSPVR